MENKQPAGLVQVRKSIGELSAKLKLLSAQKEKKYSEISEIGAELDKLLQQANEFKASKTTFSEQIKSKKDKRDELNSKVGALANKLKTIKPVKALPKDHIPVAKIQQQVDVLDKKLQTEVLKYAHEKTVMIQIKELKLKLKQSVNQEKTVKDYAETRYKLKNVKSQADLAHRAVQEIAKQNSAIFDNLSKVSKKIAELKLRRKSLKTNADLQKIEISKLNKRLADVLGTWSAGKKKLNDLRLKSEQKEIVHQIKVVEQKLKDKKKLTTEDILAMQRRAMRR